MTGRLPLQIPSAPRGSAVRLQVGWWLLVHWGPEHPLGHLHLWPEPCCPESFGSADRVFGFVAGRAVFLSKVFVSAHLFPLLSEAIHRKD